MKRDWDVIRMVLSEVEELSAKNFESITYEVSEDETSKSEHAFLLWQAGFIQGIDASTMDGACVLAQGLTWSGHEILDTIRSQPLWEKIKSTAFEKGIELTFESVRAIGSVALRSVLGS